MKKFVIYIYFISSDDNFFFICMDVLNIFKLKSDKNRLKDWYVTILVITYKL